CTAATVPRMRGSSGGRNPTSGKSSRLASSSEPPYDCVNDPSASLHALPHTSTVVSPRTRPPPRGPPADPAPRQDLGVGEVPPPAPYLPDSFVGLGPALFEQPELVPAE